MELESPSSDAREESPIPTSAVTLLAQFSHALDGLDSHAIAQHPTHALKAAATLAVAAREFFLGASFLFRGLVIVFDAGELLNENIGLDKNRVEMWQSQLNELRDKLETLPCFRIAVVGLSGSGKSSLINAVLDAPNLVPTSSMNACTSTALSIRYTSSDQFLGKVEFFSENQWRIELRNLVCVSFL